MIKLAYFATDPNTSIMPLLEFLCYPSAKFYILTLTVFQPALLLQLPPAFNPANPVLIAPFLPNCSLSITPTHGFLPSFMFGTAPSFLHHTSLKHVKSLTSCSAREHSFHSLLLLNFFLVKFQQIVNLQTYSVLHNILIVYKATVKERVRRAN